MLNFIYAPLAPVRYEHLKKEGSLELREQILNHRLLDIYYAQLRTENLAELRRLKYADLP